MQLDETYLRESFKGISFDGKKLCQMEDPIRQSYHRGSAASMNGFSTEQICVMTGVNDFSQFFFDVCCRARPSTDIVYDVLRSRICEGAIVNTDSMNAFPGALKELQAAMHNCFEPRSHLGLNKVNSLHSEVKNFLYRFRGVSTKWLCHYIAWMKWLKSFVVPKGHEGALTIAIRQIVSGDYSFKSATIRKMHIPFRDRYLSEQKTYF